MLAAAPSTNPATNSGSSSAVPAVHPATSSGSSSGRPAAVPAAAPSTNPAANSGSSSAVPAVHPATSSGSSSGRPAAVPAAAPSTNPATSSGSSSAGPTTAAQQETQQQTQQRHTRQEELEVLIAKFYLETQRLQDASNFSELSRLERQRDETKTHATSLFTSITEGPIPRQTRQLTEEAQDCPICLLEITDIASVHTCGHSFDYGCIQSNRLGGSNRCPMCRGLIIRVIRNPSEDLTVPLSLNPGAPNPGVREAPNPGVREAHNPGVGNESNENTQQGPLYSPSDTSMPDFSTTSSTRSRRTERGYIMHEGILKKVEKALQVGRGHSLVVTYTSRNDPRLTCWERVAASEFRDALRDLQEDDPNWRLKIEPIGRLTRDMWDNLTMLHAFSERQNKTTGIRRMATIHVYVVVTDPRTFSITERGYFTLGGLSRRFGEKNVLPAVFNLFHQSGQYTPKMPDDIPAGGATLDRRWAENYWPDRSPQQGGFTPPHQPRQNRPSTPPRQPRQNRSSPPSSYQHSHYQGPNPSPQMYAQGFNYPAAYRGVYPTGVYPTSPIQQPQQMQPQQMRSQQVQPQMHPQQMQPQLVQPQQVQPQMQPQQMRPQQVQPQQMQPQQAQPQMQPQQMQPQQVQPQMQPQVQPQPQQAQMHPQQMQPQQMRPQQMQPQQMPWTTPFFQWDNDSQSTL